MPTEHFKSKGAYDRFNAYTHMHGIPTHIKTAVIAGKAHKVKHGKGKKKGKSISEAMKGR
jgi:hypothetical protein